MGIWVVSRVLAVMNILGQVFCGQGSHFCLGMSLGVELLGHGVSVNATSLVLAADTGTIPGCRVVQGPLEHLRVGAVCPSWSCPQHMLIFLVPPTTNIALFTKSSCSCPLSQNVLHDLHPVSLSTHFLPASAPPSRKLPCSCTPHCYS